MRKVKILLFLFLFFGYFTNTCLSWDFEITAPTGNACWPTNYYYNSGYQYVNINFTINGNQNDYYYYYVKITQGGQSYSTSVQEGRGNKTVPLSYSNICFNNDARIDVYVRENNDPYESETVYFRLYSETQSLGCITGLAKSVAVDGESYNCFPDCNWRTGTFYNAPGCAVASGNYYYIRYKVEWTKSGSFSNSSIIIQKDLCNGYDGAIPNYQRRWGAVDNITSNSAHFYTFVYHLKNSLGQDVGWWPCEPQDAAVVYSVVANPVPIISGLIQSPPVLYPSTSCTITCNLSQGNCCNVSYHWSYANKPAYINYSVNGNQVYLTWTIQKDKLEGDVPVPVFTISCYATNNYGTSPTVTIPVRLSSNAGGCPWLFVETTPQEGISIYSEDNNILNQSQFVVNLGNDITDLYKINSEPYIDGDIEPPAVNCQILESNAHYSYFDQIKLWAIDHLSGTKVVVGNDNNIYVYDESGVVSTERAFLNGSTDITDEIQYGFDDYSTSDSLDYMTADYSNATFYVPGIISGMEGDRIIAPIVNKDICAYLDVNSGEYTIPMAMRERNYEVVSVINGPFQYYTIENLAVNYLRYAKVNYISVAEMTANYDQYELPLYSAIHSEYGDLTSFLTSVDQFYCEMDSLNNVTLKFNASELPELEDGYIREYVFEVTGKYVDSIPEGHFDNILMSITNTSDNVLTIVRDYKLYSNYPNPFNPITNISYDIGDNCFVSLTVYNILGQEVKTLVNEFKVSGHYSVEFDASNFASGIYFYKIATEKFKETKKMVLVK